MLDAAPAGRRALHFVVLGTRTTASRAAVRLHPPNERLEITSVERRIFPAYYRRPLGNQRTLRRHAGH